MSTRFGSTPLVVALVALFIAPSTVFAQAVISHPTVTTEATGAVSGSLTVGFPPSPCVSSDTVSFTGNVHVVTSLDLDANTMDVHVNLMAVKGTGSNGEYIGNGAQSFLNLTPAVTNTVTVSANLFPPSPCRASFTTEGALPYTLTFTLGTGGVVNTVTAVVGP